MPKSARELELIIMRLKSQIEAKNEQIEKTNQYIQEATDQTQKIIVRFRAFCAKILENELAYSRITTRELETMPAGRTACQGGSNAQTGTDKVQGNLRDDEA